MHIPNYIIFKRDLESMNFIRVKSYFSNDKYSQSYIRSSDKGWERLLSG